MGLQSPTYLKRKTKEIVQFEVKDNLTSYGLISFSDNQLFSKIKFGGNKKLWTKETLVSPEV
jgi:hypothetical protein